VKVQEWIHVLFEWLGVTDPTAMNVGVGVVVGFVIATLLTVAVRLALFVISYAIGLRR